MRVVVVRMRRISAKRFDRWVSIWRHVQERFESIDNEFGVALYDPGFLRFCGRLLSGRMVAMASK